MKKICIIQNLDKDIDGKYTDALSKALDKYDCTYSIFSDTNQIIDACDLIITLGGDGTIIHAAEYASKQNTPILGINLGRVGYLAEIETSEFDLLQSYFDGNYVIEDRMMLSCKDEDGNTYNALNDIVIHKGSISNMVNLKLSCNGSFVSNYLSDALIFSTPTGSTAYSLSAGGPIVDPSVSCILTTPVSSCSISSRPTIFNESSNLEIINMQKSSAPYLVVDGYNVGQINSNKSIVISKSSLTTKFIKIKNDSFYTLLGKKVN